LSEPGATIRIGDREYTHDDYQLAKERESNLRQIAKEWGANTREEQYALLDKLVKTTPPEEIG